MKSCFEKKEHKQS